MTKEFDWESVTTGAGIGLILSLIFIFGFGTIQGTSLEDYVVYIRPTSFPILTLISVIGGAFLGWFFKKIWESG